MLEAGQAHRGQGTRNRRLGWPEQYFELLWVTDRPRRAPARCGSTVARSGRLRGQPVQAGVPRPGRPGAAPGVLARRRARAARWIHRANERCPERPVVFVLETAEAAMDQRRPLVWMLDSSGIAVPARCAKSASTGRPPVRAMVCGTADHLRGRRAPSRVGRRRRRCLTTGQRRPGHLLVASRLGPLGWTLGVRWPGQGARCSQRADALSTRKAA
jgi:hypothetical protein